MFIITQFSYINYQQRYNLQELKYFNEQYMFTLPKTICNCFILLLIFILIKELLLDRIRIYHQLSEGETSLQMRYNQLSLQKRIVQFTKGTANQVFSFPWRILRTSLFSCTSNLVQIYLIFFIQNVHLSPLNDYILSVTTSFLCAQFPKNCERFNISPAKMNLSTLLSSESFKSIQYESISSFCTITLENKIYSQSFISFSKQILNFISEALLPLFSSQVNHIHFRQSSQSTFIFVILLNLNEQPAFSNCSYDAIAFPLYMTTQGKAKSFDQKCLSIAFYRSLLSCFECRRWEQMLQFLSYLFQLRKELRLRQVQMLYYQEFYQGYFENVVIDALEEPIVVVAQRQG